MSVKGTIREIKIRLEQDKDVSPSFLEALQTDSRAGVRKLAVSYIKKQEARRREKERIDKNVATGTHVPPSRLSGDRRRG